MSTAPDTAQQRLDEYQRLFGQEKTSQGIRFRLRAEPGVAAWVRDLADREKACCALFALAALAEIGGAWLVW